MVTLKTEAELATMRGAGRVVARTLAAVASAAQPGVRLDQLDERARDAIASLGAKPSFLDYHPSWAPRPYPAVVCLSVNHEIVHGIPGGRVLRDGDLLSIDCGAYVDGLHGDAAVTVGVGDIDDASQRLSEATRQALDAGLKACRPGARLGDISAAIGTVAQHHGYGVPDRLGGHGIGTAMHEDPPVPNTGRAGRGVPLREGLVLAIEPMFVAGGRGDHRTLPDGWTVVSRDGSRAAHFEHTVAITASGPRVLTVA